MAEGRAAAAEASPVPTQSPTRRLTYGEPDDDELAVELGEDDVHEVPEQHLRVAITPAMMAAVMIRPELDPSGG
eukprot:8629209-Alexandrium_andersonii.AAC.1